MIVSLSLRFWSKVKVGLPEECWPWVGSRNKKGYGRIGAGGRKEGVLKAHRVSWVLHYGAIPDGMLVCHKCDNPVCVNPRHLFLGSYKDNTQDMVHKGRMSPPPHKYRAQHHNAKFTEKDRAAILTDPRPARLVANDYGVSEKTIYRHRRGESWGCACG